ncbi:MAG: hypothetical protein JEZ11_25480 [Desulfobacterales bacterium]|nr:hypothetical protein [Desulfobacterales bacterium]
MLGWSAWKVFSPGDQPCNPAFNREIREIRANKTVFSPAFIRVIRENLSGIALGDA